jgi:hypothetical protein
MAHSWGEQMRGLTGKVIVAYLKWIFLLYALAVLAGVLDQVPIAIREALTGKPPHLEVPPILQPFIAWVFQMMGFGGR